MIFSSFLSFMGLPFLSFLLLSRLFQGMGRFETGHRATLARVSTRCDSQTMSDLASLKAQYDLTTRIYPLRLKISRFRKNRVCAALLRRRRRSFLPGRRLSWHYGLPNGVLKQFRYKVRCVCLRLTGGIDSLLLLVSPSAVTFPPGRR